jgi:hypothetical protein
LTSSASRSTTRLRPWTSSAPVWSSSAAKTMSTLEPVRKSTLEKHPTSRVIQAVVTGLMWLTEPTRLVRRPSLRTTTPSWTLVFRPDQSVGSYNPVTSVGRRLLTGTLSSTSFPRLHLLCRETVFDLFAHVIFPSTGSLVIIKRKSDN